MNIKDYLLHCIRQWKWFATSVAACLLLAIVYLVVTPPKYTRKAQILIKEDGGMGGLMGQLGGLAELGGFMGFGSSNVYNELYAMQSPWLMLNVVKQLHLDITYTIKGIRNKDLYGKTLPITVDFRNITDEDDVRLKIDLKKSGEVRLYKLKKNDDKYDDELSGRVNSDFQTSVGKIHIAATPYLKNLEDDEVTITVQRTELMATVERLKKTSLNLAVSTRDASIIDISCKDKSKERAVDIINAIIAEYRKETNEDKDRETEISSRYVEERLYSLESELKTLDQRVGEYKSKTLMPDLEVMSKVYAESAKDISTAHMELSGQLYVAQAIRDYLRDKSKKDQLLPALLISENKGLQEQVAEYNALQLKRSKLIASSNKDNPLVADLDKQLGAMHDAVLVSAENAIKQLQIQLRAVDAKRQEGRQMLSAAPMKAVGGLTDERDWKVLNEVYAFLLQKREEARMAKALKSDVRVLTPPLGVKKQSSPVKSTVILAALLLGLFIPACWIFILERKRKI